MVHLDALQSVGGRDTADLHAFGVGPGVALGGANDGGGAGVFFETDVELGKRSVAAGEDYFVEVGLEEGGGRLGFGIAEAAVEFEHGGSCRCKPCVRWEGEREGYRVSEDG